MATIADNIQVMAEMVSSIKRRYHLTETTVMRIVDMNFAIAQQNNQQSFSGEEDLPFDSIEEDEAVEGDEEVLAAVEPTPINKNSHKRAIAQTEEA